MFVLAVNGSTHVSASPADDRAFAWVFHTLVLLERNIFANHARLCVQLRLTSGVRATVDCVHTRADMGTES